MPGSDPARAQARVGPAETLDLGGDALLRAASVTLGSPDLFGQIVAATVDTTDARSVRSACARLLSDAKTAANQTLRAQYATAPLDALGQIRAQADLTDALVRAALDIAYRLHPLHNPTEAERISVLAVGGFGRAEMAPHSDVDLLFLFPWKITPWAENIIESLLYVLWDLKLKVGHSSRTVKDCIRLGREDFTIRTALLEHRYIAGDHSLAVELDAKLWSDLFRNTGREFIEAKLAEREERHRRQGGKRYVLEPNVKEAKGGLRDLQTLYWIGKYLHRGATSEGLVGAGLLSAEEYGNFRRAENFLWAARCHMHYITGRATDQLTFDLQVEVAAAMGYADSTGRRAVEHFMQDYFRHATRVGELTRVFLTELEARHVKPEARLAGFFMRGRVKPGFKLVQGRIDATDPAKFLATPLNFLAVFEEALRSGYLLHPNIMRLIAANLHLIDDKLRDDPRAAGVFLDLMLKHGNPERALRRMNELGVLSAFIPDFENIVAMMQFNVYHHYTVDEHIIQCISVLAQIERGELVEELPVVSGILKAGVNRRIIYVALLLHDIGKGRPEDHSIIGAQIARRICPRLGLTQDETETVEWLVRYHLLMSDMAQKRDVGDPRTVRDFAKAVETRKRLDLLTVLTVCDIRGVGPGTWNNWKAMLLRQLYGLTADALEGGLETFSRERAVEDSRAALRLRLSGWSPEDVARETARHYDPYWQGLNTDTQETFARLLRGLDDSEIRIDLTPEPQRDATRASFALADHPGIFSRLAGALALVGANVVDARTYTSKDGYATAVFWIQDTEGHPYDVVRLPRLRGMIDKTLKGEVLPRTALADRDRVKKREREFRFPTHITFDNEGSEIYTIIEVDTRDRPGLLFDLTRTLASANIYIASAVIATYGAQVVDTFYVKDMFGLKLHAGHRQESLEKKLRQAIVDGAARAQG